MINASVGVRGPALDAIAAAAGDALLDLHADVHHNRAVLTLAGHRVEDAARAVGEAAFARLDLRGHVGAHPRMGVVDVVPFVPLGGATMAEAIAARDRFVAWAAGRGVPCFCFGPERPLPEVRKRAFVDLAPDAGPGHPHPTAGATAVGARHVLVAYNLWLAEPDLGVATTIARALRSPHVRALGLAVGEGVQVSLNLVDPLQLGPAEAYDAVAALASIGRVELVGLVPEAVLRAVAPERWTALDLAADRTIEARLSAKGLD